MASSKGSLWRKWDFHIHTPASSISVNFGNDWDEYVKKLVSASFQAKVDAIGVTDYFSIDGYKRLKNDYFGNEKKLQELFQDSEELLEKSKSLYVFPNIELRLNCFVGQASINYHVIFSDAVKIEDIEEYFLGEVDFVYQSRPQDESLKMKIKRANLETLGERIKTEQSNMTGSNYDIGLKSAVVNVDNIKDVLKRNPTRFSGKYLLGLPTDEDLSDVSWDGRDGDTRRQLIGGVDFILCSNPNSIQWATGKKAASKEEFIREFKSYKPSIWGSDAHKYEMLFKPDKDRFCWVKSELSFEGLKQIKYEAESRVCISSVKPDEKIDYYVIDKVRFRDGPNLTFSTDWIEVNSNLTTIIGGKSSGKSLLLYYLAKTVSPGEADKLKSPTGKAPYDCESDQNFDFEVLWADGEQNSLRQDKAGRKKNITYLPQLYINSLVEGKSRKDLDKLIEDVLLENNGYADERQKFDSACRTNNAQIEQSITQLFSLLEQKAKTTESLNKLGDKSAHVKQVDSLREIISNLTKESSLSPDERIKFDGLVKNKKDVKESLSGQELDQQHIQALHELLESDGLKESVDSVIDDYANDIVVFDAPSEAVNQLVEKIHKNIVDDLSASTLKASSAVGLELQKITKSIEENVLKIKSLDLELVPFSSKFKNREELVKIEEKLKSQALVLSQFEALEKKQLEITSEIAKVKLRIWEQRGKYREVYQSFVDFIKNSSLDKIADDIKLLVSMEFDKDDFHSAVIDALNLTTLKKVFNDNYDEHNQKLKEISIETFKVLLEAILTGEVKVKANKKKMIF